jgi:hypothetical protein
VRISLVPLSERTLMRPEQFKLQNFDGGARRARPSRNGGITPIASGTFNIFAISSAIAPKFLVPYFV